MKEQVNQMFAKPYMVMIVLIAATLLSTLDRNYGFFFGLFVVFAKLWGNNFNWADFGMAKRLRIREILGGMLLAVVSFLIIDIIIQPWLEIYFGPIDLSSLGDIRGNLVAYLIIMVIVWVFAAFGEELLFYGYYMKHLAKWWGDSDKAWLASALFISIYFGASHAYQGPAGMIAVGAAGLIHALFFYKYRDRLITMIFAHGFYDMIGLTLIYLGKENIIIEWYKQFI